MRQFARNNEDVPIYKREIDSSDMSTSLACMAATLSLVMATVPNAGPGDHTIEATVNPDAAVVFAPYQILSPEAHVTYMRQDEITADFETTARIMGREFEGMYAATVLPTDVVYVEPDRHEYDDGSPCYTNQLLARVASELLEATKTQHGNDALPALVMDSVDECETVGPNGYKLDRRVGTLATAYSTGYLVFKSDASTARSYSTPLIIAHETGHALGLHHMGVKTCVDRETSMLDPRLFGAASIQDMAKNPACYVIGTRTGTMNGYASPTTVMSDALSFDSAETSTRPLFNTLDRSAVYPDAFPIETVEPTPANYHLTYGSSDHRNGIRIVLPDDHVLQTIARGTGFDRLVAALDVTTKRDEAIDELDTKPRRCGEDYRCEIRVYGESTETALRLELPRPLIEQNGPKHPGTKTLLYMDEQLGIGLIEDFRHDSDVRLVAISFEEAQAIAEEQQQSFRDYIGDILRDHS